MILRGRLCEETKSIDEQDKFEGSWHSLSGRLMQIQDLGRARPLNDLFVDKLILTNNDRWLFQGYIA